MGAGYIPGAPGTVGTVVGIPLYLALATLSRPVHLLVILALTGLSIWVSRQAEILFQEKDSQRIVIDEIVGLQYTLFPATPELASILCGFLLFRFFDIVKVFPARAVQDRFPGGYGVVGDDVVAGIYGALALWLSAGLWK